MDGGVNYGVKAPIEEKWNLATRGDEIRGCQEKTTAGPRQFSRPDKLQPGKC